MSKKEFEEMMFLDGIKPLKKNKSKKRVKKNDEKSFEELLSEESNDENSFEELLNNKPKKKDKKEKSFEEFMSESRGVRVRSGKKEKINFEEALNLYAPEDSSSIDKNNSKREKIIFRKNYSNISYDEIIHKVDLHGCTLEEAKAKVKYELSFCKQEKISRLLIVTGKGKHSKNGAVIKIAIEKMLLSLPKIIEMLEYAPIQLGGDGAFVVSLRD